MSKKFYVLSLLILTLALSGCATKPNGIADQITTTTHPASPEQTLPKSESPKPVIKEPEKPKLQQLKIGEEGRVSGITFKVNSSKETSTLTSKYSNPVASPEGTKFVIVELTLTNEGGSDVTFFPDDNFRIVDAEVNRQYTTDSDNLTNVDNYLAVRKLAPGIPETGVIVYKVPKDLDKYTIFAVDVAKDEISFVGLKPIVPSSSRESANSTAPLPSQAEISQTKPLELSQPQAASQETTKLQLLKIGQEGDVSGMKFKVNSSRETSTLTAKYSNPATAPEGTKFIVVNMTLINNGDSDATFFADNNFRIIDTIKSRQYTTDSDNLTNVDNYLAVRKLAPGIPETGDLVYKVPKDMTQYSFVGLDDPSTEGSKRVVVTLQAGGSTQSVK